VKFNPTIHLKGVFVIINDLTGREFGRWKVIKITDERTKDGNVKWLCECSCEKRTTKTVSGSNLVKGVSTNCGCVRTEKVKKRAKHGLWNTRIYKTWHSMNRRCSNPKDSNYVNYGGRGITVCEEWKEVIPFYNWAINNGYSKKLTIDRIDNDKGYYPENCRWVSMYVQSRNKRSNNFITFEGKSKIITDWAKYTGYDITTIRHRINNNLPIEEILARKPNRYFIDINILSK